MRRYDQLDSGSEPEPEPEPIPVPETDAPTCSICQEDIELDDSGRFSLTGDEYLKLPCRGGHMFHKECVDPWLEGNDTCPNCRATISISEAATIGSKPPFCSDTIDRMGEYCRGCRESTGNCLRDDRTRKCEAGTCCLLRTGLSGAAAYALPVPAAGEPCLSAHTEHACDAGGTAACTCAGAVITGLGFDIYPQTGNPCCNPNLCSEAVTHCVDPGARAPDMERGALRFKKSKKTKKTKKTKKSRKTKKSKKTKKNKTRKKTKRKSI
jgi:hypothetical protein